MNLNISVSYPILLTGQQLKVEYSTDGVTYTFDSYQTTNTFTTSYGGFVAGEVYYFRFTLVKGSPLVECDSIVQRYQVPEETDCLDFVAEIVEIDRVWRLNITYTIPSPYVQPCGGYVLKYGTTNPPTQVINYPNLPASISLVVTNSTYYVELYQVDCEGNLQLCFQEIIEPEEPECEPASFSEKYVTHIGGNWYLNFLINQSNPQSPTYTLNYSQSNALTSGVGDSGITTLVSSGADPQLFIWQVNPNMNIVGNTVTYVGNIIDNCGNTLYFDISKVI